MDNGAVSYEKYKNGDDEGFFEIVREYFDGLAAYINGIVGDFCRAEGIKMGENKPYQKKQLTYCIICVVLCLGCTL